MKSSLKLKFTLGLSIIFLASGIVLNLLIREVLQRNLENTIKNSMNDIMKNSREYVRYKMTTSNLPFNEDSLKILRYDILDYFTATYNCDIQIRNMEGKIIENGINASLREISDDITKSAVEGKAIISLRFDNEDVYGLFAYPLYYEKEYIGVININKNYRELYSVNKRILNIITLVQTVIFLLIFLVSLIFTSKITKPMIILTKGIKRVSEGDYETSLEVKSDDEIGVLSREFISMNQKIKNQIDTINKEKEKVLKLEKARREFFNNVTHELKTPLTAITGYGEMLLDENVKDKEFKKRAAERICMESERLHELVIDLINVSKGMSVSEREMSIVDVDILLEEICNDMIIKAEKYDLSLCRDIKKGAVLGDISKIRQLIINVLDNAIKYSSNCKEIYIKTFNEENFHIIEVKNKGSRIPEHIYNNIFEPFVKGTKSNEIGSRGLGLYICHEIVKEHNGEIEIKSYPEIIDNTIQNDDFIVVRIKIPSFRNTLETN